MESTLTEAHPVRVQLIGGPLDGDTMMMLPAGSVLPPYQLRYLYLTRTVDGEQGCLLIYEPEAVPEWRDVSLSYRYVGKSAMSG